MATSHLQQENTPKKTQSHFLTHNSYHNTQQQKSLYIKFRHNQLELRNKFKKFVQVQNHNFPLTREQIKNNILPNFEELSIANIRKIRKQKEELIQEMNQTLNEGRYLQHRKSEQMKAFFLVKNKYQRVQTLRSERKAEVKQLQKSWNQIKQQIRKQKLKFRKSIDQSRINLVKSRIQNQQKKFVVAEKGRHLKELYRSAITQEEQIQFQYKKTKCESVRESQKLVSINVGRNIEEKRKKVDDLKLQKVFRQLAEKQEIKIVSSRVKQKSIRYEDIRRDTEIIESKIQQFRKGLGERRFSHSSEFQCNHPATKRSFTQTHENISTKSAFHQRPAQNNSTDEIKYL